MSIRNTALILGVAVSAASSAFGALITRPLAQVRIDQATFDIPLKLNADGLTYSVDSTGPLNIGNEEGNVAILANFDPDPSIAYGLAVTDFGAPSAFHFVFSQPIVPTGSPNIVKASIVGGLTDFTGDGVGIAPFLPDSDGDGIDEIQTASIGLPTTNMTVDVGLAQAFPPGSAGALYGYGTFSDGPKPGPAGLWTEMSVEAGFTLSGGGDIAVLTGFASIEIPEPASIGLVLAGMTMLAARRRRN